MATRINGERTTRLDMGAIRKVSEDHNRLDDVAEREYRLTQYTEILDDCETLQVSLFDVEIDSMPEGWTPDRKSATPEQLAEWEAAYMARKAPLDFDILDAIRNIELCSLVPVSELTEAEAAYALGSKDACTIADRKSALSTCDDKDTNDTPRHETDYYWAGMRDTLTVM